jgi:hypothetical protein
MGLVEVYAQNHRGKDFLKEKKEGNWIETKTSHFGCG